MPKLVETFLEPSDSMSDTVKRHGSGDVKPDETCQRAPTRPRVEEVLSVVECATAEEVLSVS